MSTVSRQRLHQRRLKAANLCVVCGKAQDPDSTEHCRLHALAHRARMREATGSKAWSLGKPGRPPKIRE